MASSVTAALVFALLSAAAPADAAPAAEDAQLYGPFASRPAGSTYQAWATRSFRWFQEVPAGKKLGTDPASRANCKMRNGVVFFGPVGTTKDCVVPAGSAIVVAYLGWSCSTAEGNGKSFRALRECAHHNWRAELSDVRVRQVLDGNVVQAPRRWAVDSNNMVVDLPRNNVWGVEPGPTRSVGYGIIHLIKAPAVGDHWMRVRLVEDGKVTVLRYPFSVR
jgi:hypothetical protein